MEHLSRTHRLFKVRHWVPWPSVPVASHNIPGLGLAQPRSVGSVGLAAVRRLCSFGVSARCVRAVAELVPWSRGDLGGLSVWLLNPVEVKCFPWTLWYPEICLFTCLYCTPLSHNIPQQGQESLINSFSVFFLRWKQLRMKGGSWPVKQVHQRRGNPWINTGVTPPGFKKQLTEDARGKALNRRRDVLLWKVESSPSWGQVREGELRWKDSPGIVSVSGESFNKKPMSMFLYVAIIQSIWTFVSILSSAHRNYSVLCLVLNEWRLKSCFLTQE